MEKFLDKKGYATAMGFDSSILDMDKITSSKMPGISNILETIKGGKGLKGATEELQSAIMLPMLLQIMLGGKY